MKKIFTFLAICMFIGANAQEEAVASNQIKNGFYIESLVGTATADYTDGSTGLGLKLGSVWYFGEDDFWRPGLKTVWFRGATYFGEDEFILQASVANIGFANIFEFKHNIGLEANINFGYHLVYIDNDTRYDNYNSRNPYNEEFTGGGILINPEIKFRYNVLSIGLDFVFSKVKEYNSDNDGYYDYNLDTYISSNNFLKRKTAFSAINLTFGAKF
jgi:hypothetical protein